MTRGLQTTLGEAARASSPLSKTMAATAALWFAVVVGGTLVMLKYAQTPGVSAIPPSSWPESSAVPRMAGHPVLVMFVHPYCPCSRASVGELERLVAKCPGRFSAHVMFLRPAGAEENWEKTGLWRQAEAIPGVSVHCDRDGAEARRFHAETSGATMLYDGSGDLMFEGGITPSRGHAGDSAGSAAVAALTGHRMSAQINAPVYGCALCETESPGENAPAKP